MAPDFHKGSSRRGPSCRPDSSAAAVLIWAPCWHCVARRVLDRFCHPPEAHNAPEGSLLFFFHGRPSALRGGASLAGLVPRRSYHDRPPKPRDTGTKQATARQASAKSRSDAPLASDANPPRNCRNLPPVFETFLRARALKTNQKGQKTDVRWQAGNLGIFVPCRICSLHAPNEVRDTYVPVGLSRRAHFEPSVVFRRAFDPSFYIIPCSRFQRPRHLGEKRFSTFCYSCNTFPLFLFAVFSKPRWCEKQRSTNLFLNFLYFYFLCCSSAFRESRHLS